MDLLKLEIESTDYAEFRMFILVIMTHGDHGTVENADSTIVKLTDIYKQLSPDNFKAMAQKPKLIIEDACAGLGGCIKLSSHGNNLVKIRWLIM